MEIIIGKTAGFCFGVSNAVTKTQELLKQKENVYCLGELVHNKQVTEELKRNGLNVIDEVTNAKENVIIRAHGEPQKTYTLANELGIEILDLTCPKVLKIHKIAKEYADKGYYILLVGHKEHPETIGTISYCGKNSEIIENENDIEGKISIFYKANIKKLAILVQTTYSLEKFNKIIEKIKKELENKDIEMKVENTICNATKIRQEETEQISKEVDAMIIIGGKHSSNTNKLYEISKKYCNNSFLVETKSEIEFEKMRKFAKIGIMAGASTPKESINSVVEMLKQL